jgi:hypothetical protein
MTNALVTGEMPAYDEDHSINVLKREMQRRRDEKEKIEQMMRHFTTNLFTSVESAFAQAQKYGIGGLTKPRRIAHPAGDWRQALQIFIEDWNVIIVPLVGAAWPNPKDDAKIHSSKFKEACGRVAMFIGDDPNGESFYDFLIFADGSWFAWGYGWPRIVDNIEMTNFEQLGWELVTSFVKDIHTTWRPRKVVRQRMEGTLLSQSLDAKKRAYDYGLPGDE